MLSLAFLEVQSRTKISQTKSQKDYKIGLAVVLTVTLSYVMFYAPIIFGGLAAGDKKVQLIVATFNALTAMPNPFLLNKT